ncbi:hypothetical protein HF272_33295, partial [Rhizobium leguminosarum]|nr:hypothetical protein [Rhizobium leguminosarum]
LRDHGAPVAFYSDKHSVFRVAKKEAKGGQGMTQFGRALCELNKSGPRRAGQTDHMFGIPDGSQGNGYHKRGRKPGRRTDFMNDPEVIPKRQKALMRQLAE